MSESDQCDINTDTPAARQEKGRQMVKLRHTRGSNGKLSNRPARSRLWTTPHPPAARLSPCADLAASETHARTHANTRSRTQGGQAMNTYIHKSQAADTVKEGIDRMIQRRRACICEQLANSLPPPLYLYGLDYTQVRVVCFTIVQL